MMICRSDRLRAVPVGVEDVGELRHHRADDEGVHVDEVVGHAAHEVFVGDVAPAGDDHRAVGDEQLVVHAVVDAPEVAERRRVLARQAVAAAAERIEEAHLDVRERGETENSGSPPVV